MFALELLSMLASRPTLFKWRGTRYLGFTAGYVDLPRPDAGDTVYAGYGGMDRPDNETDFDFIGIPATLWGDYVGSGVDRSNYRSLVRDYPETFVEITWDYNSHSLAIWSGAQIDESLAEIIVKIADIYPLYDEEDHSALEMEILEEDLDSWIIPDIRRELDKRFPDTDWSAFPDPDIRSAFYDYWQDAPEFPYMEDATTIYVPLFDEVVRFVSDFLTDN